MTTDAHIVRRLWIVLVIYEMLVITIVAGAGLNIALMGGGSIAMAAPLALIACAEALRIPLSALATRLRLFGRLLAAVALLAIAVGSAEGLAVAFEAFLQNRVVEIMHAGADVERAQQVVDMAGNERNQQGATVADLTAQVKELDDQVAALAHDMPTPPASSGRTCTGRKGAKITCTVDAVAVAAYATAMKAYNERLKSLTDPRGALQSKVDAARRQVVGVSPEASKALLDAKETFEEKAALSPVWRLTAAVFSENVSAVTEAQFATVKKFVTVTLAITFATLSLAVSVVVHAKLRSDKSSKLSLALRKMFAARRRTLRRIQETVRVEYRDRVRMIYVPVDGATGRIIDPDGKLGKTVDGGKP